MANKVKFGLRNVHYAKITEGEDGSITYATPVAIPGAVNLSMEAQGDNEEFYADDGVYYAQYANSGYQGTLELALLPDGFRKDILGETEDATDHVMMEYSTSKQADFALLYQFSGDATNSLRVLYRCSASRAAESGSTVTSSRTPQTETLNLTATARPDGLVKARTNDSTPASVVSGWFNAVWLPTAADPEST